MAPPNPPPDLEVVTVLVTVVPPALAPELPRSNLSLNRFVFSGKAGGVCPSAPLLSFRRADSTDSELGSRWRPIRPSFSMAMKLVRIRERGRGDSVPAGDTRDLLVELEM